jgi:tetratricopeptide (TPR) repeat protein
MATTDRLDELLSVWQQRHNRGVDTPAEELAAGCPDLLPELERRIQVFRRLSRLAAAPGETPPHKSPERGTDPSAFRTAPYGPSAPPGSPEVPGYEILGELGRGGMGVVYRAQQTGLNRPVALKMVLAGGHAAAGELSRFRGEAEAVARLQHPHVVQVFDIGEAGGLPYIALEFCPGGSLAQRLDGTPWPPPRAAELVETLARAVHAAHRAGVVHRDLKPANVLMAADGAPKVADFGLARRLDAGDGQTGSGAVMGTPCYMAPEQAGGGTREAGPPADVYALGAILYELMTGRPPFKAATAVDTILQVIHDDPVPPRRLQPKLPRDLETVALRCLAKEPHRRYASAEALADDLRRFLDDRPVLARPTPAWERAVKWARRSPAKATATTALVALVGAALAVLYANLHIARQEAELRQGKLAERDRRDGIRADIDKHFAAAQRAAAAARWADVEAEAGAALALIASDATFAEYVLRTPIEQYRDVARRELAGRQARDEARARLARLEGHLADAVFHRTLLSGLRTEDNRRLVRQAVADGLALFGVTPENDGPPAVDLAVYEPEQAGRVAAACAELLTLEADAFTQPRIGEPAADWHGRLREALRRLDRAERLGRRTNAARVRRASILEQLGDADAAHLARQQAEATALATPTDFFLTGLDRYRQGDYAAARGPLTDAMRLQPDHFGAQYVLAACLLQQRLWASARDGLTACVRLRPDFPWAYLLRGLAESELGNYQAADADVARVLGGRPDSLATYVAYVNRGASLLRRRRWAEAEADLRRAVQLDPRAHAAHVNLARLASQRAKLPAAPEAALWLSAGPLPGLVPSAVAMWKRDTLRAAIAHLDRAVEHTTDEGRLYHERAGLHLQLGDVAAARGDLVRAAALATGPAQLAALVDDLLELARQYRRNRDEDSVLTILDAVLQQRPDEARAHRLRAEALLASRRVREAGEALDRYLDLAAAPPSGRRAGDPARELANAFRARGLMHAEANQIRSALDCYTLALRAERGPEALRLRGRIYLLVNAPVLALADFDEALQQRRDDGDAMLGRADARVKLGQVAEALADAEAGLKASPTADWRPRYFAARVYAQAAGHVSESSPSGLGIVVRYRERAVELLRQALERMPAAERAAVWRDTIANDPVLREVRGSAAFRTLAAEYGRNPAR